LRTVNGSKNATKQLRQHETVFGQAGRIKKPATDFPARAL
jgi:hypothetical protein